MNSKIRIDNVDFTISQSNDKDTFLVDATSGSINVYLPYSIEIDEFNIKRLDEALTDIVVYPRGSERIENEAGAYLLKEGFARLTLISSKEGDWWVQSDEQSEGDLETIHFLQLNKLTDTTIAGTPGTADGGAMSYFGQLNISRNTMVSFSHIHRIRSGSGGESSFEIYRRRAGSFTMIASGSIDPDAGEFATRALKFVDSDARRLAKGDYVFCQMTSKETGGARGFTIDLHFTGSRY